MNEQTPPYYPENIPYQPPPQGTPSSPEKQPEPTNYAFPGAQPVPNQQPVAPHQQQTMGPPFGQQAYNTAQPQYSNPAAYYQAVPPQEKSDQDVGIAVAGFTLGIMALFIAISQFTWITLIMGIIIPILGIAIPILGIAIPILGIVLSVLGRRSTSRRTLATIGLIISAISTVLYLGFIVFFVVLLSSG